MADDNQIYNTASMAVFVGSLFRARRAEAGLGSLREFCESRELKRSRVSQLELGQRGLGLRSLLELLPKYGITLSEFLVHLEQQAPGLAVAATDQDQVLGIRLCESDLASVRAVAQHGLSVADPLLLTNDTSLESCIGHFLKQRRQLHLENEYKIHVARRANVNNTTLGNVEVGKQRLDLYVLIRLVSAYKTTLAATFEAAGVFDQHQSLQLQVLGVQLPPLLLMRVQRDALDRHHDREAARAIDSQRKKQVVKRKVAWHRHRKLVREAARDR